MKKIKDYYFNKSKKEGYVARSIYKLEEIDKKNKIFSRGNYVLDFGCSPGSWIQYSCKKVGKNGFVVGVDVSPIKISLQANVKFLEIDIFDTDSKILKINNNLFDVILSDMSPKTSGIRSVDSQRSIDLNFRVLQMSDELLKPNGTILLKCFQGKNLEKFRKDFNNFFSEVKLCKPSSSRSESVEIFLLGRIRK